MLLQPSEIFWTQKSVPYMLRVGFYMLLFMTAEPFFQNKSICLQHFLYLSNLTCHIKQNNVDNTCNNNILNITVDFVSLNIYWSGTFKKERIITTAMAPHHGVTTSTQKVCLRPFLYKTQITKS